jgi:hypothetical protein
LTVIGLLLTAAGMWAQILAGSGLYPTISGPIVLLLAAVFVALGPVGWTPFVGFILPLLFAAGAIIAAAMTGEFIDQLTSTANFGILLGSAMHMAGLVAALTGGVGMLLDRPSQVSLER